MLKTDGLQFQPNAGQMLMCDFDYGYVEPEMRKVRPVIVISSGSHRSGLCTVIPFSTSEPLHKLPHHVQVPDGIYPAQKPGEKMWAKCDMIACVSLKRLDRIKVRRNNERVYLSPYAPKDFLLAVRKGTLHALGMAELTRLF